MGVDRYYEEQDRKTKARWEEAHNEQLKNYLDNCIWHWRKKKKEGRREAQYYIDAYQSVRLSILKELLPEEE